MIICAAIKIQVEGLDHETIIPCRRHGDGFKILKDLSFKSRVGYKELAQGFITHQGEFLNRKQAFNHAVLSGQLSQTTLWYIKDHNNDELCDLYSEDLY